MSTFNAPANVWGSQSLQDYAFTGLTTIYDILCVLAVTTFKALVTFDAAAVFNSTANFLSTATFDAAAIFNSTANFLDTSTFDAAAIFNSTTNFLGTATFGAAAVFNSTVNFITTVSSAGNFFAANVISNDIRHNGATGLMKIGSAVTGAGSIEIGPSVTPVKIDSAGYVTVNGGGKLKGNWDLTEMLPENGVSRNTIIGGRQVGDANNTTGNDNSFYGFAAGDSVTTGFANVCIGAFAGYDVIGGFSNTLIGYLAGGNMVNSFQSTCVGTGAGQNIISGCSTFVGNQAGLGGALSDPVGATAMGCQALFSIAAGLVEGPTAFGSEALKLLTTGDNNTAVGYKSLSSITTETDNTALGYLAGSIGLGSQNTFVGTEAGKGLVGDSHNNCVAIGWRALVSITTGNNNTAIGSEALRFTADTAGQTAVGFQAGKDSTGSQNTYIGYEAGLGDAGDSQNNAAVGYQPLKGISTGDLNCAFGYQTLFDNTTGSNNIAIGNQALFENVGADDNIAIGNQTLHANTTGSNNIAIGKQALLANVSADHNIAIGENALAAVNGDDSVAVGTDALTNCTLGGVIGIGFNAGANVTTSTETTGRYHVFMGYQAGGVTGVGAAFTGSESVGIGFQCLGKISGDAIHNTGLGSLALADNTTGDRNTGIGRFALEANTVSRRNTAIGDFAGGSYNGTTASTDVEFNAGTAIEGFNVFLGDSAGTVHSGGTSARTIGVNNIFIGYLSGKQVANSVDHHAVLGNHKTQIVVLGGPLTTQTNHYGALNAISDARDKIDIGSFDFNATTYVEGLHPKKYRFNIRQAYIDNVYNDKNEVVGEVCAENDGSRARNTEDYGLIAQEVLQLEKDMGIKKSPLVNTKDPENLTMTYNNLIPILVQALQETNARVEALEEALAKGKRKYAEMSVEA